MFHGGELIQCTVIKNMAEIVSKARRQESNPQNPGAFPLGYGTGNVYAGYHLVSKKFNGVPAGFEPAG